MLRLNLEEKRFIVIDDFRTLKAHALSAGKTFGVSLRMSWSKQDF